MNTIVTGVNTDLQYLALQQRFQYKHQYGKQSGMGAVMQSLTPDQRQQVSSMLQSLSEEERLQVKEQILQLDLSSMTADQLFESIVDIISSVGTTADISVAVNPTGVIDIYA